MRTAVVLLAVFLVGCKDKPAKDSETARADVDVKPAFDGAPRQIDSKVAALCEALHQMPAERKAACCRGQTEAHFGGECARVVALALEQGTLQLVHSEACVRDLVASHQGCGWVGPNAQPLPASCQGVTVGSIAQGKRCRSTLECAQGLRCLGAGPTAAGTCAPPGQEGMACELSVDVLVSYLRQTLPAHLECAGYCQRHRCESVLTDGGACTLDAQCAEGQRCGGAATTGSGAGTGSPQGGEQNRTCVAGALGDAGERCVPGGCAGAMRCVAGTCATPKFEGQECAHDVECLGACLAADGGKRCGPGC